MSCWNPNNAPSAAGPGLSVGAKAGSGPSTPLGRPSGTRRIEHGGAHGLVGQTLTRERVDGRLVGIEARLRIVDHQYNVIFLGDFIGLLTARLFFSIRWRGLLRWWRRGRRRWWLVVYLGTN